MESVEDQAVVLSVSAAIERVEEVGREQQQNHGSPASRYLRKLQETSVKKKDEQFCVWLGETGEETDARGYLQLWDRAGSIAQVLASKGLVRGDRAVLCFNFGLDFLDAFIGCMRLGVIAVPIYPPNPGKLAQGLEKMALIISDSGAKICLVDSTIDYFRRTTWGWPEIEYCVPAKAQPPAHPSSHPELDRSSDDDVAFLQYTSGSTGDPKGVILTFGNIFCNMLLKSKLVPHTFEPDARGCSWLPQYHDMGLLFCTLYPLATGVPFVYMSPSTFIKRPVQWLAAMSKHRCTYTVTPNFAYGLAARKYTEMDPAKRPQLDLSCVRLLGNAAEPVRVATMQQFLQVFSDCALDNATVCSAYGLAEHTVMVSVGKTHVRLDPTLESCQDSSGRFVACGEWGAEGAGATGLVDARIVQEKEDGTEEVEDGQLGEIWLRSPCSGKGYWAMEERSRETFGAQLTRPRAPVLDQNGLQGENPPGFLRSGDEGFFERGADGSRRLFVCGRIKDLIIVRGRNLYPQDLERTCETAAQGAVRLGCSAAFQSMAGARELAAADVVCEVNNAAMPAEQLSGVCQALAAAVRQEHAVKVRRLTLLRPRMIPKTTSGKIRRKETRMCTEAGDLLMHSLMVWEDMTVDEDAAKSAPAPGGTEEDGQQATEKQRGGLGAPATRELCLEWVLGVLRGAVAGIAPDDAPAAMGLDSVTAHELCHKLSVRVNRDVNATDLLGAETVRAFSDALFELTHDDPAGDATPEQPPSAGLSQPSGAEEASVGDVATRTASTPLPPLMSSFSRQAGRAGAGAVCGRMVVHVVLLWWVLCSIFCCALPAVMVAERFLDSRLFPIPLRLFRSLVEPRVTSLLHAESWDSYGPPALLPPEPAEPIFASPHTAAAVGVPLSFAAFVLTFTAYTILLKWVLLGRVRPGDYPLWGWLYWRRWVVLRHAEILIGVVSLVLHDAAPLAVLYTLLGARIGRRCKVECSLATVDWDLLAVADATSAAGSALFCTAVVARGTLHLRAVSIGERCELQDKAVVCPGVTLPPRTRVLPNTVVAADTIPSSGSKPGQTIEGRPARVVAERFEGAPGSSVFAMVVLPAAWLLCLVCTTTLCLMPVVTVSDRLLSKAELSGPGLAAAVVGQYALYLTSLCCATLVAKWALLGRSLRRGAVVRQGSLLEVRRECVERLNGLVHRLVLVYMWGGEWINLWYRLLGARIAPGTVLSVGTLFPGDWDAVEVGRHCMIGGNTIIKTSARTGTDSVVRGVTFGDAVTTGAGSTIGAGSKLGHYSLVTTMSCVPADSEIEEHAYVAGSVVRQRLHRCYTPHQAQTTLPRYLPELLVWALHASAFAFSLWAAMYLIWLLSRVGVPGLVLFPLGGGLFQVMRLLLCILAKWTVCRYRYPDHVQPLHDDVSMHSVDSRLSSEGTERDLTAGTFWFASFSRSRQGSRELSPEPGSRRKLLPGGRGAGSGRFASRDASPEPGSTRALTRPQSSPAGLLAQLGDKSVHSDGGGSRGRLLGVARADGSMRAEGAGGSRGQLLAVEGGGEQGSAGGRSPDGSVEGRAGPWSSARARSRSREGSGSRWGQCAGSGESLRASDATWHAGGSRGRLAGQGSGRGRLGLLGMFGFFQELYLRHWYNVSLLGGCLKGGPLANVLFKCLRTGRVPMSTYLGSIFLFDFEFVEFDEDVAVNEGVSVSPHVINSTTDIKLQKICVGEGATLWPTARCMGTTNIPSGAQIAPLSRMDPAFHKRAIREAAGGLSSKMLVGVPAVSFVATGFETGGGGAVHARLGHADAAGISVAVNP